MTKAELISKIQEVSQLSKKDTEKAVSAFLEVITESLKKGEKIPITKFGTFLVREHAERKGHNPKTGETMVIPSSKAPAFKASKVLKALLNSK